ncbi:hypothetical protein B7463_g7724, partial [Scytalidium lignicola]
MAENASSLFYLELIRQRDLSEQETNILNVFAHGMYPATLKTAEEAAYWLDCSCPPLEQGKETEVEGYFWMIWEIMLDITRSPDVSSEVHQRLIVVLRSLKQCAKGDLNV